MKNIVLARVDDRLIHGQITIGWLNKIKVDTIIIINKELRTNTFLSEMTKQAAPDNYRTEIFNTEEFIEYYKNRTKEDILILSKEVKVYENIQTKEEIFSEINIGNIGSKDDSKKIYKNVHINSEEKKSIKNLLEKNCNIYLQMLPEDSKINIEKLI